MRNSVYLLQKEKSWKKNLCVKHCYKSYQIHYKKTEWKFNNFENSKLLPSLQDNKLAYHSFMDGDRRHKSLGSEMKESLLLTTTARQSIITSYHSPKLLFPQRNIKRVRLYMCTQWLHYRRGILNLGDWRRLTLCPGRDINFITLNGKSVTFARGGALSLFSKALRKLSFHALCYMYILRKITWIKE